MKFHNEINTNKPKFNFLHPTNETPIEFSNPNLIIVDKGRNLNEHSVILIENEILLGYCFVDLEYQINHTEILKSLIIPLENNLSNRFTIKTYLQKNKVTKIIRY